MPCTVAEDPEQGIVAKKYLIEDSNAWISWISWGQDSEDVNPLR